LCPGKKAGNITNIKDKKQKSYYFVKIKDDIILAQSCGIVCPGKKAGNIKYIKDKRQKSSSCVNIKDDIILAQSCGIVCPGKKAGNGGRVEALAAIHTWI
jgi:hypothetical protein